MLSQEPVFDGHAPPGRVWDLHVAVADGRVALEELEPGRMLLLGVEVLDHKGVRKRRREPCVTSVLFVLDASLAPTASRTLR